MESPSSSKQACYDVFINHNGKDVKLTVASTIYWMLDSVGAQAFLDKEELHLGDPFPQAIKDAINSASVCIAIFSPRYAQSAWCLDELCWMLQTKATIIPVFYDVQPTDVRFVASGIYAEAFRQHRKKLQRWGEPRYTSERIRKWEEALHTVADISGQIMGSGNCDQGKLVREIVDAALKRMTKAPLGFATRTVGLDEAVGDFGSKVGFSTERQNVHIVGIVGMGGCGKTTLAKELYNRKCSPTIKSSFLSDVKDKPENTLEILQKQLLDNLGIQYKAFHNRHEGIGELVKGVKSMRVLIVLDDVNHVNQINYLLPEEMLDNLGGGSLIIIATRNADVMRGISSSIYHIYHMKLLDIDNAKKLFCRHAFLYPYSQIPDNYSDFQDVIRKFVNVCKGLPLTLKVFGGMVNGQSKDFWESQFSKICRMLPEDIIDYLRVSYDALGGEEKEMFLDTACFFIGEQKSLVVPIWDGSGWSGVVGWEALINKCLIRLDKYGHIEMHDHVRDLGRHIAKDAPTSRIWKEDQWKEEQNSIQGREKTPIRGIVAGTAIHRRWSSVSGMITSYALPLERCMENLKASFQLLAVRGNDFRKEIAASDLVWLRVWDFEGAKLPSWLSLAKLRVLELYNAKNLEELWQDNVEPPLQLRQLIIKITLLNTFGGLPSSIGRLSNLEKIVLHGGFSEMSALPKEICELGSLEFLELRGFTNLSSLPHDFGKLRNLRYLKLEQVQLTALPETFKQLKALQSLSISRSENFMFTSDKLDVLESMTELKVLSFELCPKLEELPHLTTLVSLRELHLSRAELSKLPNDIGQLPKLETLVIGSDNLTSLPESLGSLSCLTSLKISGDNLTSLPESLGSLSCLTSLKISGVNLTSLPESLGGLCCLTSLEIRGDYWTIFQESRDDNLTSLPESLGSLSCLTSLGIRGDNLTSLPESLGGLCCLTSLKIRGDNLTSLPESLGSLSCLTYLEIRGDNLTSLPESLGSLSCLTSLEISGCAKLVSLPETLARLPNLQSLSISETPIVELSLGARQHWGGNLKSLKSLYLYETHVGRISISDDCCPSLEDLELEFNKKLTEIESLPRNVTTISVHRSKKLKNMKGISGLQKLQRLTLTGCRDLEELPCPAYMRSLGHTIKIRGCPSLKGYESFEESDDDDEFLYGHVLLKDSDEEESDEEEDDDEEGGDEDEEKDDGPW